MYNFYYNNVLDNICEYVFKLSKKYQKYPQATIFLSLTFKDCNFSK